MSSRACRRAVVIAMASVLIGAAPAAAGPAESGDVAAGAAVEWVVGSDDTFADVVQGAVTHSDAVTVAAHLEGLEAVAASGSSLDFPGLDALAPADAARVLGDTAAAVAAGAPLPDVAEDVAIAEGDDEPFPWNPDQSRARILELGRSYEQFNWLRRGETTSTGDIRWTDVVQLRWVTHPGAVTSRVDYWLTHPKSLTGYFGASRVQSWAFTGDVRIGAGQETAMVPGQAIARWVHNQPAAYGGSLWHGTVLTTQTTDGFESSSSYRTIEATCRTAPDRTCTYS